MGCFGLSGVELGYIQAIQTSACKSIGVVAIEDTS